MSRTKFIILAVGIGTFMASLDSGAVNLAMPLIRTEFSASLGTVEWIVTAYLLVISSLLLTFGRIADLYGPKKVYSTGFIIFLFGSLLCGISSGIGMLIVCRGVQALGAGMLMATGPAIITNAVDPAKRGKALSVTAIAVALGASAGPAVGGALATFWGWQSIFFINLPIGGLGLFLVLRAIPGSRAKKSVPFDIAGSSLVFVALLLFLLPLSLSGDGLISGRLFTISLCLSVALFFLFILVESKTPHPMLNLGLFENRTFAASNVAALFIYLAQFILVFLTPFYFQTLRGYSAFTSGLLYLAMPLATMCVAPLSGAASDAFDGKYISSAGAAIMALGLFLLGRLTADSSVGTIVVSMAVTGAGFGLFQTPNNSAIMGNVPPSHRGVASGTLATMRNIGMATGVAVGGFSFSLWETHARRALNFAGSAGPALESNVFVAALSVTFRVAAAAALLAMVASLAKAKPKEA